MAQKSKPLPSVPWDCISSSVIRVETLTLITSIRFLPFLHEAVERGLTQDGRSLRDDGRGRAAKTIVPKVVPREHGSVYLTVGDPCRMLNA